MSLWDSITDSYEMFKTGLDNTVQGVKSGLDYINQQTNPFPESITNPLNAQLEAFAKYVNESGPGKAVAKGAQAVQESGVDYGMPTGALTGLTAGQVTKGIGKGWLGSLRAAINRTPRAQNYYGTPPSEEGVKQLIESLLVNEGSGIVKNYGSLRKLEDSLKRAGAEEDIFAPVLKASGSLRSPRNPDWHGVHYPYSGEISLYSNPIAKAYTDAPTMRAANTALHEGIHAKQLSDPAFLEALKEIEPMAQQWGRNARFPGGTSYEHAKYLADPIEMMARGVANKSLQRLYSDTTPKSLYGPGTWHYTKTWPEELEPIWERLTNVLLKGY